MSPYLLMIIIPLILIILLNLSNTEFLWFLTLIMFYWISLFTSNFDLIMLDSFFHLDKISLPLILLTTYSILLIFITSYMWNLLKMYFHWITLLLILTFSSSQMISFYLFFEAVLIPTLFLITEKGNSPERLQAGIYLITYTVAGSLPLLLGITLNSSLPSFLIHTVTSTNLTFPLLFFTAFLVKLPIFFFHLWLPKAHVEAPLEGSMILAAILLKLGGYGLIRFSKILFKINNLWSSLFLSLSLISMFFMAMNCLRQKDLKSLIAYSSVAHMALTLGSIFSNKTTGEKGAMLMMISHGLSSSALFFLVTLIYKNFHSRNIILSKSLISIIPSFTFWWFLFSFLNFSIPPSLGMISEIFMFISLMEWNFSSIHLIMISSLSVASFSIILFSNPFHNSFPLSHNKFPLTNKNFLSLFSHSLPLFFLFINPSMLSAYSLSSKREIVVFKITQFF